MKILCPACGKTTEEGAFCEMCGAPQTPAPAPEAAGEAVPGELAAERAVSGELVVGRAVSGEPEPSGPAGTHRPANASETPRSADGLETARQERLAPPMARQERLAPPAPCPAIGGNEGPLLEVDRMCIFFENMVGSLRFRLDPGTGGLENVRLSLEHAGTGQRRFWGPRRLRERKELRLELGKQPAGNPTWTVRLEYEKNGRRQRWEGDVDLVVARPREARRVADSLKVEITNHINLGNASDAHVNQRALDGLETLSDAEDPFKVLQEVVGGSGRSWQRVELYETSAPPPAALRDRVALSWGGWRLHVFAGPVVKFGRNRPCAGGTDFTMRPGPGGQVEPYRMISGEHCTFERIGGTVFLRDGVRTASGLQTASKNGTWWEDGRVEADGVRLEPGATGLVSFAGTPGDGAVTLRADRGDEWLLLRRTDGVEEAFLVLWGAFDAGRLDGAAGGLELCRKDGAFAWRANGLGGWLVPGETADLPWGPTRTAATAGTDPGK